MEQPAESDDEDLFGDEDAPQLVKDFTSSEEAEQPNSLAEEIGEHPILQSEELKETELTGGESLLLRPVFVNKKDREVMQVNQEHQIQRQKELEAQQLTERLKTD